MLFAEATEFVTKHLNRGSNVPYSLYSEVPYFETSKVPANGIGWYTLRYSYVNVLNIGDRPFLQLTSNYPILLRNWDKEELPWWFNINPYEFKTETQPIYKGESSWVQSRLTCPVITIYCENCNRNLQCNLPHVRIEHI